MKKYLTTLFILFTSFNSFAKPSDINFIPLNIQYINEMATDCYLKAKKNNIEFFSDFNSSIIFLTKDNSEKINKNILTLVPQNNSKFNATYSNEKYKLIFSKYNTKKKNVTITFFNENKEIFSHIFKTSESCL